VRRGRGQQWGPKMKKTCEKKILGLLIKKKKMFGSEKNFCSKNYPCSPKIASPEKFNRATFKIDLKFGFLAKF